MGLFRGVHWSDSQFHTDNLQSIHRRTLAGCLALSQFQVGINHHLAEFAERNFRLPAELVSRFARVTTKRVDFRRSEETRVLLDVFSPIQAEVAENFVEKLANRVRLTGGDDEVVRLSLLQHQPHGFDVISRETPVSPRV